MQMNQQPSQDQATGLRDMMSAHPVKVITVTAGKGGVGKTNVSVNLAIALAKQKQRVLLMDADLGLANVDVMLGLHAKKNLSHVLDGQCDINDIILEGPDGVRIIPSSSGTDAMTRLAPLQHAGIISAFNSLTSSTDVLIVDTAAGISDTVTAYSRSAQDVVIVVCDEPTSITDAYALIKVLSKEHHVDKFHVLANMVPGSREGIALFNKLYRVTEQFLDVVLDYVGAIPFDEYLRQSVRKQQAVVNSYPSSSSAREFKKLAKKVLKWPVNHEVSGHSQFFINRLIQFND